MPRPDSYVNPKIEIKKSPLHKRGAFAKEQIKKNEVISVSGGTILHKKEYSDLIRKGKGYLQEYCIKIADEFYLGSLQKEDFEKDDYFNHSCNPNAGLKGQLMIVAMRDVKPDEEITFDYAMVDNDKDDIIKCSCGAKNCRKVITGSDWKKPELQKRYKGYFAWHIQEKIDNQKYKRRR